MTDGTLRLIDPTATGTTDTLAQSQPGARRSSRSTRSPGSTASTGGTDFAVSYQTRRPRRHHGRERRSAAVGRQLAAVCRPLPVSCRFAADGDAGLGCVPQLVSGDQGGTFPGQQHVGGADHGDVARGAGFGVGLLVRTELGRRAGVPDGGDHGGRRADLGDLHDGRLHGGGDGSCAATNNTDIWRGYLVITPVNHPADARLVAPAPERRT